MYTDRNSFKNPKFLTNQSPVSRHALPKSFVVANSTLCTFNHRAIQLACVQNDHHLSEFVSLKPPCMKSDLVNSQCFLSSVARVSLCGNGLQYIQWPLGQRTQHCFKFQFVNLPRIAELLFCTFSCNKREGSM